MLGKQLWTQHKCYVNCVPRPTDSSFAFWNSLELFPLSIFNPHIQNSQVPRADYSLFKLLHDSRVNLFPNPECNFKVQIQSVLTTFCFWLPCTACLLPWLGIELVVPAVEAQSFNHWSTGEVLKPHFDYFKPQFRSICDSFLSLF